MKKSTLVNLAIIAGIYFALKAISNSASAASAPSSYASRSTEYNLFTTNVDDLGVMAYPETLTYN